MSEPTAPVTVPDDIKYYLTRVDRENGSNPPSAMLDVFQWSTEYGTTINKKLKIYFGAFVGKRTKAEVLDPARRFFDDEDVEFKSGDVLVDVSKAPLPINIADHPDLKQLPLEKLKKGVGVAAQALIVNQFGDLITYDPISLQSAHEQAQAFLKTEREPFENLKYKAPVGGGYDDFDGDEPEIDGDADGSDGGGFFGGGFGRRQANPIRRPGRSTRGRDRRGRGRGPREIDS